MVRVEVTAYPPTEFLEERDVTIGRCRELVDADGVTWVNVVDPDNRIGLAFALILMGFVGAIMIMFFRRRKWL